MNYRNSTINLIARQYNEKWRFPDYDRAIKKLQCHHIHSFLSCNPQNFEGIIHDYDVPVYVCKFSPSKLDSNVLAVANENGTVCIENVTRKRMKTYVQTHNNTVFDLAWMPREKQFVTVSGDHSAKLWDCGQSDIKMVSEFLGHTRSVKCVYFKPENTSVFATGSRDGSLILWDARCSTKCSKLPISHTPDQIIPSAAGTSPYVPKRKYYPVEASQSNSVTGLIFQNDTTLISSGSSDQLIRIWDMRKTYSRSSTLPIPRYQLSAPSPGFSHICVDPAGTKLYANSMDSYIYCFNINSYQPEPIAAYYGHQNGSFYVKSSLSHDGWYLLSGSSDKYAYIWNTRNAELSEVAIKPIAALPGHTAEVACVVMSLLGDMKVATCSDDGTYRLWYNYMLEESSDNGEIVEASDALHCDYSSIVRTQWKNKRKRSMPGVAQAESQGHCTFHSKICRYYSNSLTKISCKCQYHVERSPVKRAHEEEDDESSRLTKRRSQFEIQERTPPRSNEIKTVNRFILNDPKFGKSSNQSVKFSSKRKLSDMPNFAEDGECKRRACDRVLVPVNGESERDLEGVGVISDFQGSQLDGLIRHFADGETEKVEDSDDSGKNLEFSSPTTNLPNYVKDGTSPYLHRCPKTQKENLDWLTKLRKSNGGSRGGDPEEKDSFSLGGRSGGKVSMARRKLVRSSSSPGEGKSQTLHKYFKVSSKQAEINYFSQDVQKKAY